MSIEEIQREITTEFSFFDNWEDRYEHLISLGKSLENISEEEKKEENLIKGCQSRVWLVPKYEDGRLFFRADSDAIIPRGIIGMIVKIYSGQKVEDIMKSSEDFIDEIGLREFLSPNRANGLLAMIKQIKYFALVYSLKK